MINIENIDELISKFLAGEASPEEAMLLEDWKNESEANVLYFVQCEKIFYSDEIDVQKGWNKIQSQIKSPGKIISIRPSGYFLRIAASIVFLIGLGGVMMYWFNNKEVENHDIAYVANAEPKHVVLSDGSDVTISPNSTLTEEKGFGKKERTLNLKGSAYFSVVHNERVPFVVNAGGVFIKDIGTRFMIQTSSDTDTVHVHVDEGIVLLFDDKNANVEIKAGGNALYVKSTKQIITEQPKTVQSGNFNFSNNTLADVVKNLNAVYHTHIKISNPALNNCTITTQFNNEKLETILSVIAETLGLTYEKTDTGYILKGDQCHQ